MLWWVRGWVAFEDCRIRTYWMGTHLDSSQLISTNAKTSQDLHGTARPIMLWLVDIVVASNFLGDFYCSMPSKKPLEMTTGLTKTYTEPPWQCEFAQAMPHFNPEFVDCEPQTSRKHSPSTRKPPVHPPPPGTRRSIYLSQPASAAVLARHRIVNKQTSQRNQPPEKPP